MKQCADFWYLFRSRNKWIQRFRWELLYKKLSRFLTVLQDTLCFWRSSADTKVVLFSSGLCLLRCSSRLPPWPSPCPSVLLSLWGCCTCPKFTSSSSTRSRTSRRGRGASRWEPRCSTQVVVVVVPSCSNRHVAALQAVVQAATLSQKTDKPNGDTKIEPDRTQ